MKDLTFTLSCRSILLLLLLLVLPNGVKAQTVLETGKCGDNLTWTYTDDCTLTISGKGPMYDYTYRDDEDYGVFCNTPWKDLPFDKLVIERGCTRIGDAAFSVRCAREVYIPETVTSVGSEAFADSYVSTVIFGPNVTELGYNMFYYARSLRTLVFLGTHDFSTMNQNSIFEGCPYINLYAPSSVVDNYSSWWYYVNKRYSIEVPSGFFIGGWYLAGNDLVLFGDGSTGSIEKLSQNDSSDKWEQYKDRIQTVNILPGVTTVSSSTFKDCTNLKTVNLPRGLKEIQDRAFQSCTSLQSISLPSTVTRIWDYSFAFCVNLNSIDLNYGLNTIWENVFEGCTSLRSINIPNTVEVVDRNAFRNCTGLQSVTLGSGVKTLGWYAFENCTSLQSLTLPKTLQEIGDHAFVGCSSMNSITFNSVPKCDQAIVYGMSAAVNLNLTDDSYIYTGSNRYMPTCANATYTRSIAASSNWGTLVLPFRIASDENVQLYELSDVSSEAMTFSEVDQVAANTPCVFKKKNAAATSLTFAAADVNVTATATPSVNSVDGWTVKGTYEGLTDQTGKYYIAKDGFWYAESPISIKPFRAWFENAGSSQVKAFSIFAQENDMEDSIEALEEMNGGAVEYYDLNGRRMDGLQKGINIIKYGQNKTKKVIIK